MPRSPKLSLFRRVNGIYYILFHEDGRVRWKSTGCSRKSEALKVLTEFERLTTPKLSRRTLNQFTCELLRYAQSQFSPKTVSIYAECMRKLESVIGDCPLSSLNARNVDEFKAVRSRLVRPVSVNVELRTLRAAFNIALRWNLIERNPFAKVKLAQVPATPPPFFAQTDFRLLLETIREPFFREIVLFAAVTGLRRGEIVNLKWERVDLAKRIILVTSDTTFRTKGGRQRILPMSDVCHALLSARAARSDGEYVFNRKGRPHYAIGLSKLLKQYVRELGFDGRLHFHSLRHSFASWLAQANVSIYTLKELLGHSSIQTTQVYSHLTPSELHGVVNKIDVGRN